MKKTVIKKIIHCISGLTFLALAGCSNAANFTNGDVQTRNEVEMVRIPYMITFVTDDSKLSNESIEQLDIFMMKSNVSYGDEISIDLPLQRDGSLTEQNQKKMSYLAELFKKRGLRLSAEVTPYGLSPDQDQARLLISRYVVTPPRCGNWTASNDNFTNAATSGFGCSNQANLGLMVANPRDLIIGETNNVPDTESAAKAVHTYRIKKPTKLSKNTKSVTRRAK